jgi:hypothetical protein
MADPIAFAVVAYVDPTSGGILLQALLGGSAAYLLITRFLGRRLRQLFRRGAQPERRSKDVPSESSRR